jgi:hypothetical protein
MILFTMVKIKKPVWIGRQYYESHYAAAKALPDILGRKLSPASALQYVRIAVSQSNAGESRIKLLGGLWVSEIKPEPVQD